MNTNATRRSVLKMSAALAVFTGAATATEKVAAGKEFVNEAIAADKELPKGPRLNPALFAEDLHQSISGTFYELGGDDCPESWAAWAKAEHSLYTAYPDLPLREFGAFSHFQEATLRFALDMLEEGIRRGATFENLRNSLVKPLPVCVACGGSGIVEVDHYPTPGGIDRLVYLPVDQWRECAACSGSGRAEPPQLPFREWPLPSEMRKTQ